MGMIAYFAAVPVDTLTQLQNDPESAEAYLLGQDDADSSTRRTDIEKSWHGIHYLLTGEAHGGDGPLSWAIFGGTPIGPDGDYGPVRLLLPGEVSAISLAMAQLSNADLAQRYAPGDMEAQNVYPEIWVSEGQEGLSFLLHYYQRLADFYHAAAARGDAVLLSLF